MPVSRHRKPRRKYKGPSEAWQRELARRQQLREQFGHLPPVVEDRPYRRTINTAVKSLIFTAKTLFQRKAS